ncbi:MAG: outer membrane beta-barrel protein, partial [Planctomycetes bacterium]|nr:outer membrane beta-barrel protein [Planctomycetota bacterium]
KDDAKYVFDSVTKNLTGETSESFGLLPTRFQLGTGTTDPIVALFFMQRFGKFQPSLGLSYQFSGGENAVGYERSDRFGVNAALKYTAMKTKDCRELYLTGGFSSSTAISRDFDHSEDVTRLGSQPVGRVPNTDGTYSFWSLGVGYDLTKSLAISLGYTDTLTTADEQSNYSFDQSISLGLQYRF